MLVLVVYLRRYGYHFQPSNQEIIHYGLGVADGTISYEAMLKWVKSKIE